jgi:hypothetical protein
MSSAQTASVNEISPALLVDAMFAVRKTAAIKAAIELDLFTVIGTGQTTKAAASEMRCAERGVRILCDYLVVAGFLSKSGDTYALTPSSAVFLDRHSPAYMGSAIDFIAAPQMLSLFLTDPAACVRNGGAEGLANLSPDNPVWVRFARAMGAFTGGAGRTLAADVAAWPSPPSKVLDIAAGPGYFGIEFARAIPQARIVALDWKPVLDLTRENATAAEVHHRCCGRRGPRHGPVHRGGDAPRPGRIRRHALCDRSRAQHRQQHEGISRHREQIHGSGRYRRTGTRRGNGRTQEAGARPVVQRGVES